MPDFVAPNPNSMVLFPDLTRTAAPEVVTRLIRCTALHVIIEILSAPGSSETLRLNISGVDAFGRTYPLLSSTPLIAAGVNVLKISPGAAPVPNAVANDYVPERLVFDVEHSASGAWRYRVSANPIEGDA